ncbi:hypothetical protein CIB84_014597 [Bambusicola thoracicus]|uniref:Uncharacterized protein n=1 Tax=Bambusicola thoracicus TaxID=9083 RepID=A0A2P4SC29_BAMTH|nr:hypothetical protein CIB84_014597 [Bambusicola thoracicus]
MGGLRLAICALG